MIDLEGAGQRLIVSPGFNQTPTAEIVERSVRRARRRRIRAMGGLAALLMIAGVTGLIGEMSDHADHVRTAGPTLPTPTTMAAPRVISDVAVLEDGGGYVVSRGCLASTCEDTLQRSPGPTGPFGPPLTIRSTPFPGAASTPRITFADATHGLAWTSGEPAGLATVDGGAQWQPLPAQIGSVTAAASDAGTLWVASSTTSESSLLESKDGGETYANQGPVPSGASELIASPSGLYLVYPDRLLQSTDAGRAWRPVNDPCPTNQQTRHLAVGPTGELWLACAGEGGAGAQSKSVLHSEGAGRAWTTLADCSITAAASAACPEALAGYVSALTSPAPGVVLVAMGRGGIVRTTADGPTWTTVVPGGDVAGGGAGATTVSSVGEEVWAVVDNRLSVSSDAGESWKPVDVAPRH